VVGDYRTSAESKEEMHGASRAAAITACYIQVTEHGKSDSARPGRKSGTTASDSAQKRHRAKSGTGQQKFRAQRI
jgi:hypothetical protein